MERPNLGLLDCLHTEPIEICLQVGHCGDKIKWWVKEKREKRKILFFFFSFLFFSFLFLFSLFFFFFFLESRLRDSEGR